jgi:hypothetical protein
VQPRVYIETSIPSYLTARPSRDVVTAGNQQATKMWWSRRQCYELYISEFVLEEVAAGDPIAAAEQLLVQASLPSKARLGLHPYCQFGV